MGHRSSRGAELDFRLEGVSQLTCQDDTPYSVDWLGSSFGRDRTADLSSNTPERRRGPASLAGPHLGESYCGNGETCMATSRATALPLATEVPAAGLCEMT